MWCFAQKLVAFSSSHPSPRSSNSCNKDATISGGSLGILDIVLLNAVRWIWMVLGEVAARQSNPGLHNINYRKIVLFPVGATVMGQL